MPIFVFTQNLNRSHGVSAAGYKSRYQLVLGGSDQFLDAEIQLTNRFVGPEHDTLSFFHSEKIDVHW
ncbi:MAG: hypothetical protein ACRERZ_02170 [Gammaproteobacteria bacterium]